MSASCSSFVGFWSRLSPRALPKRASEQDIEALAAAYAAMERAADDGETFIGPDSDFHKTIVRSVENRMVDALGSIIEAALTISLRLSLDAPDGQRPSLPFHKKVLDAIRRRNRTGAARAMELLIDNAQQDALKALGAEPAPARRRSGAAHERQSEEAAVAGLVRRDRQERDDAPQLDEERGHAGRRFRRPPGHRHLQHLVGAHALQRAFSRAGGKRPARRAGGRRFSGRVPGDVAGRIESAPNGDALPQPRVDGRRRSRSAAIRSTASCSLSAATRPRRRC